MRTKLFISLVLMIGCAPFLAQAEGPSAKNITLQYKFTINNIPENTQNLKIWVPLPPENAYQVIEKAEGDIGHLTSLATDPKYGNRVAFYSINAPASPVIDFQISYDLTRFEQSAKYAKYIADAGENFDKYLQPSRMVVINDQIRGIARKTTEGKETTLDKARAIYDYVYANMNYDKSIPGYGNGDSIRACDIGAGNCTDFHSLFISLCRAEGIPARFKMGTMAPTGKQNAKVGYHCWAEFYDSANGWIPVDISEARKNSDMYEYYFGHLTDNRVEFTVGRDIILEPSQSTEELNYFIYPHIEIDGKPHENFDFSFVFKNIEEIKKEKIKA